MKRLLIVKPDGIGDFIIFSAVLEEYAKFYHDYSIDLLCDYGVKQLVEPIPFIRNKIYIHSKRTLHFVNFLAAVKTFFLKYDVLIYPVYSRTRVGDLFCAWIKSTEKITFNGDDSRSPQRERIDRNKYFTKIIEAEKGDKSELERHREFLFRLGANISSVEFLPKIWFREEDDKAVEHIKMQCALKTGEYAVIFPGAGFSKKLWPVTQWISLLEKFAQRAPSMKMVVLGAGLDGRIVGEIITGLQQKGIGVVDLCGRTPLRIMAKLIAQAKLLVSVDTAAVHMAAAIGTPNVCIMGGGHFGRFYPYGDLQKNRIVFNKMDCFGCRWHCKFETIRCIVEIEPDAVWQEMKALMYAH